MPALTRRAAALTAAVAVGLLARPGLPSARAARPAPPAPAAIAATDVLDLGRENWEKPWLPDLKHPGQRIALTAEQRIDVVILGDGFLPTERAAFEAAAKDWYARFLRLTPYNELRGAFRVRAVWTPSAVHCSEKPESGTCYHLRAGKGVSVTDGPLTRAAVFGALDAVGANDRQQDPTRPTELTHAFVAMLLENEEGKEPSGVTYTVTSPDRKRSVRMATGESFIHEFTHAYARVRDEYIGKAGAAVGKPEDDPAAAPSIFRLTNVVYTRDPAHIPWMHYAPGSALNPDTASVVGLLWAGGAGAETGVWHPQARCLMNGTHDNWSLDHTTRGAHLRDVKRLCFWCQELVTAKTYLKAGVLGDGTDGAALWQTWVSDFRPAYVGAFHVVDDIRERNAEYAAEKLADAKIYERPAPTAAAASGGGAVVR